MDTQLINTSTTSPSKLEGVRGACVDELINASTASPSKLEGGRGACVTSHQKNVERKNNLRTTKEFRRTLRNNSTPAECALWRLLKGKKIGGLQFRRQFSIDQFVLDFYCPSLHLAIELDGDYHYHGDINMRDVERDRSLLSRYQIHTLRFENKVVFEQPQAIINSILNHQRNALNGHMPPAIPFISNS